MKRLEEIISRDTTGHCLCGSFEYCERCSPHSEGARIRDKLCELIGEIRGIKPQPVNYGASMLIPKEILDGPARPRKMYGKSPASQIMELNAVLELS